MKISFEHTDTLEVDFEEFKAFYPLFNAGNKVLWYMEKEDRFILLCFIDVPIKTEILKEDIIAAANLPDTYPETTEKAINEWRAEYLVGQASTTMARPFKRYGGIE
jgi:hypothetical protein